MPSAAQGLWERLGMPGDVSDKRFDGENKWLLLPAGNEVAPGAPLFPRIEEDKSA
jgi:methionyl-tRNA synthetase